MPVDTSTRTTIGTPAPGAGLPTQDETRVAPRTPPPWDGGYYTGPRPGGFVIPQFADGANEEERWQKYQIYLQQHPEARGNRILHRQTGFRPDYGFVKPGSAPPAAPGSPGPPVGGPSPPVVSPQSGAPTPLNPAFPPGAGQAGGMPMPGSFNDPFAMFMSAVPGMRVNTQRQIGEGMANAGFTGNRWGSSAMNAAGQIGAEGAMMENALLQKTLYDYANQAENRALQATGMGMGFGQQMDEMARERVTLPFQIGQYEQGRQDDLGQQAYADWDKNKLGWLPLMLGAISGQGPGSPGSAGQIYTTTEPGKEGGADWVKLLASFFR